MSDYNKNLEGAERIDLLSSIGTEKVIKTTLTRKVSFAGKTQILPVYKVRLDCLYYNDQNDRIATWISKYKADNGADSLQKLSRKEFNEIIEGFIYESNPESITKTQKNIVLIGQREPGVTLSDGRIVDGNRRFTCLRRIQRDQDEPVYFETVLMDVDIQEDKKQIKLLELAIQHGEEKKVDYDLIDYAIGTYTDVEKTKLLTIEEYANSTNETPSEVKKRIDIAKIICECLSYFRVPEQFHIAREYQVYSLFQEMMAPLKQLPEDDRTQLKTIVFNNVLLRALIDQRKFIRDIKTLIKNDTYSMYFDDQAIINEQIQEAFSDIVVKSKEDLDSFALSNESIAEEMQMSMQKALLRSRRQQLKAKPAENVAKSFSLMTEFDTRTLDRMDEGEKVILKREMDHLSEVIDNYREKLAPDKEKNDESITNKTVLINDQTDFCEQIENKEIINKKKRYYIAKSNAEDPIFICLDSFKRITTLSFTISVSAIKENDKQNNSNDICLFFLNNDNEIISDCNECKITVGEIVKCKFVLNGKASEENEVYLAIKYQGDAEEELQRIIPFSVNISFTGDFEL